ncbi:hypothetical protein N7451_009093 [Penicillium sp. IBT 35674x]|nr:hypothetical protein N7451_009093 [Penicillium sp. IBT 35674x]
MSPLRNILNGSNRGENINKARDVTLENCLDLMQIYEDQDPGFFVKHGVKVGAARRFVRDIGFWVKRRKESTCNENVPLVSIFYVL